MHNAQLNIPLSPVDSSPNLEEHLGGCVLLSDNSQLSICLPLSKSVMARKLVLDALDERCVEIEEENDDLYVVSRALYNAQCIMHNAQLLNNSQFSILNSQIDLHASGTALRFLTA